jgi:hypothetical protein
MARTIAARRPGKPENGNERGKIGKADAPPGHSRTRRATAHLDLREPENAANHLAQKVMYETQRFALFDFSVGFGRSKYCRVAARRPTELDNCQGVKYRYYGLVTVTDVAPKLQNDAISGNHSLLQECGLLALELVPGYQAREISVP